MYVVWRERYPPEVMHTIVSCDNHLDDDHVDDEKPHIDVLLGLSPGVDRGNQELRLPRMN